MTRFLAACFSLLLLLAAAGCGDITGRGPAPLDQTIDVKARQAHDRVGYVYCMRGWLGIFSEGMDALAGKIELVPQLAKRPLPRARSESFEVRPRVHFDNKASGRFTVIEVNARDRPALLNRLARAMFENKVMINSAHITNYGERAVDTFYVTDLIGHKIDGPDRLRAIESALLSAAGDEIAAAAA